MGFIVGSYWGYKRQIQKEINWFVNLKEGITKLIYEEPHTDRETIRALKWQFSKIIVPEIEMIRTLGKFYQGIQNSMIRLFGKDDYYVGDENNSL